MVSRRDVDNDEEHNPDYDDDSADLNVEDRG